jgi:hypothetical protein
MDESKEELTRQAGKQVRIAILSFLGGLIGGLSIWYSQEGGWALAQVIAAIGIGYSIVAIIKWDGLARRRDRAD